MKKFYKIYAIARLRVSPIIFTTPSPEDIAYFLREKCWYQIKITTKNKEHKIAEASIYTKEFARNSKGEFITKVRAKAVDQFKVELLNDFYQRYLEIRKEKSN